MPLINTTVSVTASATLVATPTNASNTDPIPITIYNDGSIPVYVGGSAVTSAIGIPIAAGSAASLQLSAAGELVYAITTSGSCTVRVLKGRS